jgi:hypothetical protein
MTDTTQNSPLEKLAAVMDGLELPPDSVNLSACQLEAIAKAVAKQAKEAARPQGDIVITKNDVGQIVTVTRQDEDGRILSIVAESTQRECEVIYQIKASSNDSQDVWIDCDKDSAEHNRDTHGCIMRVVYTMPPTPHVEVNKEKEDELMRIIYEQDGLEISRLAAMRAIEAALSEKGND